ncbi:VOC family protein [Natronoarchaeum sp. GCM10025703]|uniref:VOC family protein n=1 Tax=Natronoarchaeum sp. GCM10025703 TaxID=3252685 RepID=UPI0036109353
MDVQHTAVAVSDLDATKAFYEDGLGLTHDQDFYAGETHHYYVTGDELDTAIQFVHEEGQSVSPRASSTSRSVSKTSRRPSRRSSRPPTAR